MDWANLAWFFLSFLCGYWLHALVVWAMKQDEISSIEAEAENEADKYASDIYNEAYSKKKDEILAAKLYLGRKEE